METIAMSKKMPCAKKTLLKSYQITILLERQPENFAETVPMMSLCLDGFNPESSLDSGTMQVMPESGGPPPAAFRAHNFYARESRFVLRVFIARTQAIYTLISDPSILGSRGLPSRNFRQNQT